MLFNKIQYTNIQQNYLFLKAKLILIDLAGKLRKEGRLYGVRHMVKYHSDSEKGNPLPPHGLLFPINSKGSFISTIPQTG